MELNDFWQYISTVMKDIWLYGMGDGADKILNILESRGKHISGVFASDDFVRGQKYKGYTVKKYSDAVKESGNFIVLICFGTARQEVIDNIKRIMSEQEVYAPDVPVYGGGVFDSGFAYLNRDKLNKVYSMLADDLSKKVFRNTVQYKLSGDLNCLFDCQSSLSEAYKLLDLSDDESYLDLGAYRGDTIKEFISFAGGYSNIYAVEPDRKTYAKLHAFAHKMRNTELYNVCITDMSGPLAFSMKSGRNSSAGGESIVKGISVDDLLGGRKVTYIKMDIEGSEGAAIDGAVNTIIKYKPKMNIACYHRNEDIFDIPLKIMGIRSDYKLYMRHYPCIPSWDTQFYFI